MKRALATLALGLLLAVPSVWAQQGEFDRGLACGFESVTVSDTAGGLGPVAAGCSGIHGATRAICSNSDQQIRFRIDGTAPTAAVGHIMEDGDYLYIDNPGEIANASFIRTGASNSTLSCSYRR